MSSISSAIQTFENEVNNFMLELHSSNTINPTKFRDILDKFMFNIGSPRPGSKQHLMLHMFK
jgi:hypothetical protein